MKHLLPFQIFESEWNLLGDLFSVGMNRIKYDFDTHPDAMDKLEEEAAGAIQDWKGPHGEKVVEVNGEILPEGDFNSYNVEIKLTNGQKLVLSANHNLVDYSQDGKFDMYVKQEGVENPIGSIQLEYLDKDEKVPAIMHENNYEASLGLGVVVRMLNLYSAYSKHR
jgi:hypothetical protein